MAATAPDAGHLFQAAVATELGCATLTPRAQEIAALLRRLTRLLGRLPQEGAYIVQIALPGMGREPEIRPWRGIWTELD